MKAIHWTKYHWVTTVCLGSLLSGLSACATGKKQVETEASETAVAASSSTPAAPQVIAMPVSRPGGKGTLTGGRAQVISPAVVIYKMKADYSQHVPVLMDEARTRIVSYPAPADLKKGNGLRLPTALDGGYWLDNKGISSTVAFLTYTYEEYSRLPKAPSMDELMANILEKYPLTEIHECGRWSDYKDIVPELNARIAAGMLQQ